MPTYCHKVCENNYNGDLMWPTKPQMFTTWLFIEKICHPLLEMNDKEV